MSKFEPRQDQAYDAAKESALEYYKRGGTTHFITSNETALCRTAKAQVGFKKWPLVNCIACRRTLKAFMAAVGKATGPKAS